MRSPGTSSSALVRRLAPVANDGRGGCGHFAQGFNGALRAVLLDESENHREQHDHGDGNRLNTVAQECRERRRKQQDDDKYVLELFQKDGPGRDAGGSLKLVWAEFISRRSASATVNPRALDFSFSKVWETRQRVPRLGRSVSQVFFQARHHRHRFRSLLKLLLRRHLS